MLSDMVDGFVKDGLTHTTLKAAWTWAQSKCLLCETHTSGSDKASYIEALFWGEPWQRRYKDEETDYSYKKSTMLNVLGIGIEVPSSWGCWQDGFQMNQLALKRLHFVIFSEVSSQWLMSKLPYMDSLSSNALDEPYQALCRGISNS